MIHISLSPNIQNDDRRFAWSVLMRPWLWQEGKELAILQKTLAEYLGIAEEPLLFNSGRSAFLTLLKALNIKPDDEVLVQAFTCNAVPNPILWWGAKPVYVDIERDGYNMDPMDLERKITPRSRAIVIQHTFGIPANMDVLLRVAKNHKLFVIEDCAHALGAEWNGKKIGTLGDASFFSFGRDKVISSVCGGALAIRKKLVARRARQEWETLSHPSYFWIVQQVAHPLFMALVIASYWSIGKILLRCAQRAHLLSKAVSREERYGKKPAYFPARLPNALAILALHQLRKIEHLNNHRRELAEFYREALGEIPIKTSLFIIPRGAASIFLRYPAREDKRDQIMQAAKKNHMVLGDWYDSVIAPKGTNLLAMRYVEGSCPNAEKASQEVFNLPTHINISRQDAKRIIGFIKSQISFS